MSLGSSHAKRRELRVAIVALAAAVVLLAGCVVVYLTARNASRDRELRHLACSLVQYTAPGTEPGDSIRKRYECPPYNGTAPRPPRSSSPSASRKSATPRAHASTVAPNRGAPGVSRTQAGEPAPARVDTHTITRRASQPRAVTRTRTASSAPLIPLAPLPPLDVCQLVGDLVCRKG